MEARWYVVRTYSGHENKVKALLDTELKDNAHLKAKITDVLVPTEKVFEVKDGNITKFPGNFEYYLHKKEQDKRQSSDVSNQPSAVRIQRLAPVRFCFFADR